MFISLNFNKHLVKTDPHFHASLINDLFVSLNAHQGRSCRELFTEFFYLVLPIIFAFLSGEPQTKGKAITYRDTSEFYLQVEKILNHSFFNLKTKHQWARYLVQDLKDLKDPESPRNLKNLK